MLRLLRLTLFSACLFAAATARADPVTLTSGFITGDAYGIDNAYRVNFQGAGFSFRQTGEAYFSTLNNQALTPGQTVTSNARFFIASASFGTTVTYGGVTYTDLRPRGELTVAPITFIVPPPVNFVSELTAPFSLAGTISFIDPNNVTLFTVEVDGSGLATFSFATMFSQIPGTIGLGTVSYNFGPAAVPEPATLILLGTGLVGTAAMVCRRRAADNCK